MEHNTEKTLVKGKRLLRLPFQSNRTPLAPLSFSLCPHFGFAVLSECWFSPFLLLSPHFPAVFPLILRYSRTPFRIFAFLSSTTPSDLRRTTKKLDHSLLSIHRLPLLPLTSSFLLPAFFITSYSSSSFPSSSIAGILGVRRREWEREKGEKNEREQKKSGRRGD